MKSLLILTSLVLTALPLRAADYDVVIYGGTSAAVIAAVQAKKMGKSVVIVSPDNCPVVTRHSSLFTRHCNSLPSFPTPIPLRAELSPRQLLPVFASPCSYSARYFPMTD